MLLWWHIQSAPQPSNSIRLFQRDFERFFSCHESVNIEFVTFCSRRVIIAKENLHSDPKVRIFVTEIEVIIFQKKILVDRS